MCMCVKSELRLQNLILGLTRLSIHHLTVLGGVESQYLLPRIYDNLALGDK